MKQQTHVTLAARADLFLFVTMVPIILRFRNSWRDRKTIGWFHFKQTPGLVHLYEENKER